MTDVFTGVRRFWRCAGAAALLVLPAAAMAQTTPGSRVLVMPFAAEVEPGAPGGAGATLWIGEAASLLISEELSTAGIGAMTRDERVVAFTRLGLPMTSALTRATMIRVGELIGASEIVFGDVRLDGRLEVRARLVHLATGAEGPAATADGELADIFQIFGRVAGQLSGQLQRVGSARPAPAPLPLETFESYVKGLVASTPTAQQRFLETALRQASSDARVLMALWEVYSAQGVHERALASANAVPPDTALYRQARFAVALSLIELGRFDGAWQALTALHDAEPSAAVSSALGIVQMRRAAAAPGEPPTAYFARAVTEDPENVDYLFNLGYAHARAGSTAEALNWLRETVRFDVADGEAHHVMSAVLARAGRATEAQREAELARLLGGAEADASGAPAAQIPAGLERTPAASDLSSTAMRRAAIGNPAQRDQQETARFHLANARTLIEAGRDRDAVGELRRAIYLSPYEDTSHLLLGRIYQRSGRLVEAIEQFTVSIWSRETAEARVALGGALIEAGQIDAARRELARALELDPASTEARGLLGRIGG